MLEYYPGAVARLRRDVAVEGVVVLAEARARGRAKERKYVLHLLVQQGEAQVPAHAEAHQDVMGVVQHGGPGRILQPGLEVSRRGLVHQHARHGLGQRLAGPGQAQEKHQDDTGPT